MHRRLPCAVIPAQGKKTAAKMVQGEDACVQAPPLERVAMSADISAQVKTMARGSASAELFRRGLQRRHRHEGGLDDAGRGYHRAPKAKD